MKKIILDWLLRYHETTGLPFPTDETPLKMIDELVETLQKGGEKKKYSKMSISSHNQSGGMDKRVGIIINDALSNKQCDLISEDYEKRSEVTKQRHLKKYKELDASFIKFKLLPVNQDTFDRIDITEWYRVKDRKNHKFLRKEFLKFLEDNQ